MSGDGPGAPQRFADEEFLKLGARQNTRVLAGVMVATALLAWIVAYRVSNVAALAWFLAVGASQLLRVRVESQAGDPQTADLATRLRRRTGIAALCGGVQALGLAAFARLDVTEQSFFTLVLLGLATGAVANSAGNLKTVIAYGAPMLAPLVALWGLRPGAVAPVWLGPAMALLISLYAAVLLGFAQSAWKTFQESCLISFRGAELNERLQAALAAADSANRAKTRFLAAASHDLRQPLHTVVLLSSALSLRPLDERSQEIVQLLNEVTATLSTQLDDLLDISKLDAGVVETSLRTVTVHQLLAQHFAEVEAVIRDKGLQPLLHMGTQAHVVTDPHLLSRILRNLTHNAVKFTAAGSVTLSAHEDQGDVVITVADTGRGIAPEHHDEVFLEFYQTANPERDRSKGLGLGLSIVRRLCDLLGIQVTMQSTPGQGTRFALRLPRAQPSAAVGSPPERRPPAQAYDLLVFVVDDEASVRTGMRMLLEEWGCVCEEASGTPQLRELASARRPDLVLADFRLRGTDSGLSAIAAVRELHGQVPALLVSGDTAPDRLQEARRAGMRLLHKPLAIQLLRTELEAAQALKNARKDRRRSHAEQGSADG